MSGGDPASVARPPDRVPKRSNEYSVTRPPSSLSPVTRYSMSRCRPDAFGDVRSSTYWTQNDSDAAVIVQFGGTPDDPDTYAYIVPAGVRGTINFGQEPRLEGPHRGS